MSRAGPKCPPADISPLSRNPKCWLPTSGHSSGRCGSDTEKHTACRNDMTTLSAGPESGSPRSVWDGKPAGIVSDTAGYEPPDAAVKTAEPVNRPTRHQVGRRSVVRSAGKKVADGHGDLGSMGFQR